MLALIAVCSAALVSTPNLLSDPSRWQANVDSGPTAIALEASAEAPLAARVSATGSAESYPKLRLTWESPQDWRAYARIQTRLRVTSPDPDVTEKQVALVFYDEQTRLPNYPGNPMKQQIIAHTVPVGRWVELSDWLITIRRSRISQLDLYIYELGPAMPHSYLWEFASLELSGLGDRPTVFDGEGYAADVFQGPRSPTVASLATDDGLGLEFGRDGDLRVILDGEGIGQPTGQPTGLLLRDATRPEPPGTAGGDLRQEGAYIRQTARLEDLGLALDATYRSRGGYLEVSGAVEDLRGEDRAVTVYLALPVQEAPWRWWDSAVRSRVEAEEGTELAALETGRQFGLNGARSIYPLGAVSEASLGGLSLAVRMDEPVVHRIAYSPQHRLYYMALDFGLVPEVAADGRSLSKAPFRFILYRHDPAWGFRSALERYYAFFPELFTKRVPREGGWYVWGDIAQTAGAVEAGFAFHWGPRTPESVRWDNENGVLALHYIEPEFHQQSMEDYEQAPIITQAMERLQKVAAGDERETARIGALAYPASGFGNMSPDGMALWVKERGLPEYLRLISAATLRSVIYGGGGAPQYGIGQMPWISGSQWGCIFPCNLDPDIEGGLGWFNRSVRLDTCMRAWDQAGVRVDGIALDSLGGFGQDARANSRREHFAHSAFPLSFTAQERRPALVASYSTIEWLRDLAAETHTEGNVLMANCSWAHTPAWLTFAAPYLDIFGAENPAFADPDYIRAIAYRKPCTDLPYSPRPEWEVAWHQLHAIFPGHGNDVELMARYAGTLQELAAAGWEPVTRARVAPSDVRLERYGSGERFFLVLHNPSESAAEATVTLELGALGWDAFSVSAVNGAYPKPVRPTVDGFVAELDGKATAVVRVAAR